MKKLLGLLILIFFLNSFIAAQKTVTATRISEAEKIIDLNYTDAERDSLLGNVEEYLRTVKLIHSSNLANSDVPMQVFQPTDAFVDFNAKNSAEPNAFNLQPKKCELPTNKTDLSFYSIAELAYLIKNKKITSTELTKFFIDRLVKFSDTLHCVINLTEDRAYEQAKIADAEIKAGKWRGLLHGIPYGAKDLLSVKGTNTTWGAKPYQNQRFEVDATVIKKLDAAGAILIAKLSLGALAMNDGWFGGKTRNPWDTKSGSSGSSAGSASATVAGLVPFAIGTETLGSIVSPSTVCGATGLRPTFGRVSRYGAMTLCWSLDKIGPITRSANDAAIVFNTLRGIDANDKTTYEATYSFPSKKPINKMRIGIIKEVFDTLNQNRNEWTAVNALKKLGAEIIPVSFKSSVPIEIVSIILGGECAAAFDAFTRNNIDDELNGQTKRDWPNVFRSARFISAVDYINAQRLRKKMILEVDSIIRPFDAIISSNFGVGQLQITNLTGHPVVVTPSGFLNGKPTSVSFIGNYFDEATILTIANAYQEQTDNHLKHPEMFTK